MKKRKQRRFYVGERSLRTWEDYAVDYTFTRRPEGTLSRALMTLIDAYRYARREVRRRRDAKRKGEARNAKSPASGSARGRRSARPKG